MFKLKTALHMCKTIVSITRFMNVRPFYTRRHVKC